MLHGSTPPAADAVRWVFLDRDGTLNVPAAKGEYVERPEQLELLPGAGEAVALLNRAGVWVAVVTNQRGIALGRMSDGDLAAVHERLRELLAAEGATLDAIYHCPHASGECECRKPRPGMLLRAREEHPGLDFARAAIVGDSLNDMQAGRAAGVRTLLLAPSRERAEPEALALADALAPDLIGAARLLLERDDEAQAGSDSTIARGG